MAKKVFNMQGGLHSAAAFAAFENRAYGTCIASPASFVVTPGSGMNLNISTGDGLISVDAFLARRIQVTATETAAVPAANASFNRLDTLVAYIDTSVTPTTSVVDNVNDILKFAVVAGTAASTPVAPTNAAILAAIGAGKPYMALYDVLVPQGATNVAGVTLTDRRVVMSAPAIADDMVTTSKIAALAVTTAKIANLAITNAKIADGTIGYEKIDKSTIPFIKTVQSANQTLTSTTTPIAFNSTSLTNGTGFTRSGNAIVVGAGITRVRVSYSIMGESGSSAPYIYAGIAVNGARRTNQFNPTVSGFGGVSETTVLPVSPGDLLTIVADSGGGSINIALARANSFTVEAVA